MTNPNLVPTPIVDKNGRKTTVHKKPQSAPSSPLPVSSPPLDMNAPFVWGVDEDDEFSSNYWLGRNVTEFPPTRTEITELRDHIAKLGPSRTMYRGDWERVNGGYGPTLGQVRAEASAREERRSFVQPLNEALREMQEAYEASDKSQDRYEGCCRECNEYFVSREENEFECRFCYAKI